MEQRARGVIGIAGPIGSGKSYAAAALAKIYAENSDSVRVIEFADPLKRIAAMMAGIAASDAFSREAKSMMVESIDVRRIQTRMFVETLTQTAYVPDRVDDVFGMEHRVLFNCFTRAFEKILVWREGRWLFRENERGVTFGRLLQLLGTEGMRGSFGKDVFVKAARAALARSLADVVIFPDVRFENEAAFVREHGFLIHILPVVREKIDDGRSKKHLSEAEVKYADGDVMIWNHKNETFEKGLEEIVAAKK